MINDNTILSSFNDRPTLLEWLKKVEEALKDASAVAFKVNQRGNATLTFSVEFKDGSEIETGPIVLQQGESVASAAIVGGHLKLTLTNGDVLDAGDLGGVSSFSINASQHLIVHFQNGTTQDLGAIFAGNVTISGDLMVTENIETNGALSTPILTSQNREIETTKPIIESMVGYSFENAPNSMFSNMYASIVRNGNKLTCVWSFDFTYDAASAPVNTTIGIGSFHIPESVGAKLYPSSVGGGDKLTMTKMFGYTSPYVSPIEFNAWVSKSNNQKFYGAFNITNAFVNGKKYFMRLEVTYLLSDNMVV